MKLQRDKIKQYQKRLQVVLDHERQVALQCLKTGNKEKARLALRRRKYQEQLLAKADAQLETLETLVERQLFLRAKKTNADCSGFGW